MFSQTRIITAAVSSRAVALGCLMLLGMPAAGASVGYTFTTLFDPLAAGSTLLRSISGNTIVGSYGDMKGVTHGLIYDGSEFTTLDDPLASNGTTATGISGSTITGFYYANNSPAQGFVYNGSVFTTLDNPLASTDLRFGTPGTFPQAVSNGTIVGYYQGGPYPSYLIHGFIYNGSAFATLDDPLASNAPGIGGTWATGVSGKIVVGYYWNGTGITHGFVYDGSTYTNLDDPLAPNEPGFGTYPEGISGNTIVGTYLDHTGGHGFVYNGSTFTTLDDPLTGPGMPGPNTVVNGVSGDTLIGYFDQQNTPYRRGFIATPEPTGFMVAAFVPVFLSRWRRKAIGARGSPVASRRSRYPRDGPAARH